MDNYTLWVGGIEVNDYLLSEEEAIGLLYRYTQKGYDDAVIELIRKENK